MCLAHLVASPRLLDVGCRTVDEGHTASPFLARVAGERLNDDSLTRRPKGEEWVRTQRTLMCSTTWPCRRTNQ
jgi:hypothetical protein